MSRSPCPWFTFFSQVVKRSSDVREVQYETTIEVQEASKLVDFFQQP